MPETTTAGSPDEEERDYSTASEILHESADLHLEKQNDYGRSTRLSGLILWLIAGQEPFEVDGPEDLMSLGLFTRRIDKLARAFRGEFVLDDLNFESVEDSHNDESVYAAKHKALLEEINAGIYD